MRFFGSARVSCRTRDDELDTFLIQNVTYTVRISKHSESHRAKDCRWHKSRSINSANTILHSTWKTLQTIIQDLFYARCTRRTQCHTFHNRDRTSLVGSSRTTKRITRCGHFLSEVRLSNLKQEMMVDVKKKLARAQPNVRKKDRCGEAVIVPTCVSTLRLRYFHTMKSSSRNWVSLSPRGVTFITFTQLYFHKVVL